MKSPAVLSAFRKQKQPEEERRRESRRRSQKQHKAPKSEKPMQNTEPISQPTIPKTFANLWQSLKNSAHMLSRIMPLSLVLVTLLILASRTPMLWAQSNTVTYVVNTTTDMGDADYLDEFCDIDLETEGEQCSLRAALQMHSATAGEEHLRQIHFNIPGDGPHTLNPSIDRWTFIHVPITIDGSTQPGATCPTADQPANLKIVLDMGGTQDGLRFFGPNIRSTGSSGSVVRGLVIGNSVSNGLDMQGSNYKVECNHIGVAADGVTAMPNGEQGTFGGFGVSVGENSIVGGDESHAQRNVIASSAASGVSAGKGSKIMNNYIGTTADGLQPLGNDTGVSALGVQIGGANSLARNIISGNTQNGVRLLGENNQVWGNFIGLAADGITAIPNGGYGLWINIGLGNTLTHPNIIGGVNPDEANLIANNGKSGIGLYDDPNNRRNQLRGNGIYNNGEMGIDIGEDGPDTNDIVDSDDGPNKRQNYPLLSSVRADGQITGSINSAASQTFEIDFYANANCDTSGYGEGEIYIGGTTVTTDEGGNATFDTTISGGLAANQFVTATATDDEGSTSEFSQCLAVDTTAQPTPSPTSPPGLPDGQTRGCLTASGTTPNPSPTTTTVPTAGPTAAPTTAPTTTPNGNTDAPSIYLPFLASGGTSGINALAINAVAINSQSNVLVDGGTVTGTDGVMLGAVAGTLMTETLVISITQTSAPTQTFASTPTIHGHYYQIAASRNAIVCGQEKGFVLGLPVPATADTEHLALAVLSDGSSILDRNIEGQIWTLLEGLYDPNEKMFLTTLAYLGSTPQRYALVTHPDFDSPISGALRSAAGNTTRFHVKCLYFANPSDCEVEQFVTELALDRIAAEFAASTFPQPHLRNLQEQLEVAPPSIISSGYTIYIEPLGHGACVSNQETEVLGYYDHTEGRMVLCHEPSAGVDYDTIVHEYFHAIEFGYETILFGEEFSQNEKWVLEGMAEAAVLSYASNQMIRSTLFPLHKTDSSLKTTEGEAKSEPYSAQDFWVYYGLANGYSLNYFDLVLVEGATSYHVATALDDGTKLDVYWDWIKNQVMLEDGILLNDDDEGERCTFQSSNVTDGGLKGNEIFRQAQTLEPLTSLIARFDDIFIDKNVAVIWTVATDGNRTIDDGSVQFKFYIADDGCNGALENPTSVRHDNNDDINPDTDFYVIVSNTHPTAQRRITIYGD